MSLGTDSLGRRVVRSSTVANLIDNVGGGSSPQAPRFVIGIGASAGGLEAIEGFVRSFPEKSGVAIVVVQHLSPDFESHMEELLARKTRLPIRQVEDGMMVERDTIYLIPPRKEMVIVGGKLLLTEKSIERQLSHPIDQFFRSLANDYGPRGIGVILSGTGSDGTRGIVAIHEAGGYVLVQDERSAQFDGMPLNARSTGIVDKSLPPHEMPLAILRHVESSDADSTVVEVKSPTSEENALERIFDRLQNHFGLDFSHYKAGTVSRRLQRRLESRGLPGIEQYADFLHENPGEARELYKDLLIGVTEFFRDREAFDYLQQEIVPSLLRATQAGNSLRLWVAGCATGQEAYSLAMLVDEAMQVDGRRLEVKIFATDVHHESINFAARGLYLETELKGISPERLDRYFRKQPDGYQIIRELRQYIVFAPHNVINDAPFTQLDLVTCRNLLIYFQPTAQRKALSLFHFALKANGILFLGPSETPGELSDEFEVIHKRWRFFRKRRDVRLPVDARIPFGANRDRLTRTNPTPNFGLPRVDRLLLATYDKLLERKMPPSLLVNSRFDVIHVFGEAKKYLVPPGGRPSNHLSDLISSQLKATFLGALQQAVNQNKAVRYSGIAFHSDKATEQLTIQVEPLGEAGQEANSFLIEIVAEGAAASTLSAESIDAPKMTQDRVESLESQLRSSQENLQATIEEMETANEELQATNEELISSNEELQSTNEELHSVNEELFTVNAEYQRRVEELAEANDDMDNLLATTRVGVAFLDKALNIRRFTPAIGRILQITARELGRPIRNFAQHLRDNNLMPLLERVSRNQVEEECESCDLAGNPYLVRALPYRSSSMSEGVVLTLIDIRAVKAGQEQMVIANALAEQASRSKTEFLTNMSHELRTPMTAMLGFTDILRRESIDPEFLDRVDTIRRNGEYLLALINDILDLSKIEAGNIEIDPSQLSLKELVDDVQTLMAIRAAEKNLRLSFHFLGPVPKQLTGDRVRLRQVLVNLIANAIKFTQAGEVRVQIGLLKTADRSNTIAFDVIDTGIGISEFGLTQLFKPFSQVDRDNGAQYEGTGLGLSISKRLAERMMGDIEVTSRLGEGSRFRFWLPIAKDEMNDLILINLDENSTKQPRQTEHETLVSLPAKVLLADDRRDVWRVAKYYLEQAGATVSIAENGQQAIEIFESATESQSPFDVVLMDMQMPVMNGREAVSELRKRGYGTPIIALTADAMTGERAACLAIGCNDYIAKPIDGPALLRMLANVLKAQTNHLEEGQDFASDI
jgi:two-component system, chemotaxis family, CheB/CheR fusion protein